VFSCAGKQVIIGKKEEAVFRKSFIFLRRKTMDNRKSVTEADLLAVVQKDRFQFPPLQSSVCQPSQEDG
jgi:hypothetical protein